jgi:hypothetical protein
MKKFILILIASILCLTYCKKDGPDPESNQDDKSKDTIANSKDNIDPEFVLKIGKELTYKYSDIEMYDSSTHILYFTNNHPELDDFEYSDILSFIFFVDGDSIYYGDLWPTSYGILPIEAYIQTCPLKLQNYALWIEFREKGQPDFRNDSRIIEALKTRNLLHSGLFLKINSLIVKSNQIDFTFTITNQEQSPLLILDPDKMGLNLFHYFSKGLVFRKSPDSPSITVKIPSESPSSSKDWNINWLTKLGSGESKTWTFNYPLDTPIDPGEYIVSFNYPGLSSQIERYQLIQNTGRIWLGEVIAMQNIIIK